MNDWSLHPVYGDIHNFYLEYRLGGGIYLTWWFELDVFAVDKVHFDEVIPLPRNWIIG
jgi:hypothetical protein